MPAARSRASRRSTSPLKGSKIATAITRVAPDLFVPEPGSRARDSKTRRLQRYRAPRARPHAAMPGNEPEAETQLFQIGQSVIETLKRLSGNFFL